jgi:hypothetical protein
VAARNAQIAKTRLGCRGRFSLQIERESPENRSTGPGKPA